MIKNSEGYIPALLSYDSDVRNRTWIVMQEQIDERAHEELTTRESPHTITR
jgi:hypothetical protein